MIQEKSKIKPQFQFPHYSDKAAHTFSKATGLQTISYHEVSTSNFKSTAKKNLNSSRFFFWDEPNIFKVLTTHTTPMFQNQLFRCNIHIPTSSAFGYFCGWLFYGVNQTSQTLYWKKASPFKQRAGVGKKNITRNPFVGVERLNITCERFNWVFSCQETTKITFIIILLIHPGNTTPLQQVRHI